MENISIGAQPVNIVNRSHTGQREIQKNPEKGRKNSVFSGYVSMEKLIYQINWNFSWLNNRVITVSRFISNAFLREYKKFRPIRSIKVFKVTIV